MRIPISAVAATALAAATMAAAASGAGAHSTVVAGGPGGSTAVTLAGSVVPFAGTKQAIGLVPAGDRLTIQVWLAPQTFAAANYATAAATPGNPRFGQFMSPAEYAARFGATPAAVTSVERWLTQSGFTGVAADAGDDYVQATAPVSTIDTALKVRLRYYRSSPGVTAGKYLLRANDRPVS